MGQITGEVTIDAPIEDVFDTVADERNEPKYNPRIAHAEKLSEGPVDAGASFVAEPKGMGAKGTMTLEILDYDKPHRLHNVIRSSYMLVDGTLTFEEVAGGTRLKWDWDMGLLGPMRVLSPLLAVIGPRWERRNWVDLKKYLESGHRLAPVLQERDRRMTVNAPRVLEVHLEELGQHSWLKALFNTLTGTYGSAQFRFVARVPGDDHRASDDTVVGATFPVMRAQDLNNLTEPNAWIDIARERLAELDDGLVRDGWRRASEPGPHWWSATYTKAA